MAEDPRHALERRGPDRHRLDRRAELPRAVDQGVEGRVGEGPAEDLQALLAAAHPGQPVVDQGDPQPREALPRWGRRRRRPISERGFDPDAGFHARPLGVMTCQIGKDDRSSPGRSRPCDRAGPGSWRRNLPENARAGKAGSRRRRKSSPRPEVQ